jgi:hypothetical protein
MPNLPSFVFAADCEPSRFVKISANHTVTKCTAGERAFGVTHEGSREAPIPGVTPLVAKGGETARVYGAGESCEIVAGGTVNAGQYVKPDSDARAVACSTSEIFSAVARSSTTAAGQLLKVTIITGTTPAT